MAASGLRSLLRRTNWWQVGRLVGNDRWRVVSLSIASFVSGVAEAAFLVVLTRVGFAVADGADTTGVLNGLRLSVPLGVLLAAALLLVRLVSSVAGALLTASLAAGVTSRIRSRLAHAFLSAPWSVQQAEPTGRLQQLVGAVAGFAAGAVTSLSGTLSASLSLTALMAIAVMVDPLGTLMVLAALVLLGALLAPIRRHIRFRARLAASASMSLSTHVADISQLGLEMHSFGAHGPVCDLLEVSMSKETESRRRANFLSAVLPTVYLSLAFGALLTGVFIASEVGVSDLNSVGAVLLIMLRSLSYGQQLQTASGNLALAIPSLEQVDQAMSTYRAHAGEQGAERPSTVTPVEIDNVSYAYDGVRNVVAGITLRIESGEILGIIGPSGAGKSTLVQLLLGLRFPTAGVIRAGGVDVRSMAPDEWRRRVSFVPQEAHLLTGTVIENIRFFRDDISIADIRRAATLAGVIDDIERLPDGFDTDLGERGTRMSGGQRQRLSIARALAARPDLLVLDEPTSALDAQSESIIRETLYNLKGEVTVAVIAHRMSTLEACDRLAVIENGLVSACGTPAQLRELSPYYRRVALLDD